MRTSVSRRDSPTSTVTWVGLAALVLPLVPLVVWAFTRSWRYPAVLPSDGTLRGARLLTDPGTQTLQGLSLSLGIGFAVAVLACTIGLPAGRAIGLHRFRGRRLVQLLLLAPVFVPGLAVVMGLQVFLLRLDLAGTVLGVVLVQLVPTVPYTALLLGGAFATFDPDHERQARSLGAGPFQVLIHVTLPLMRSPLLTAATFAFLISWSEYLLTVMVGAGEVRTLPVLLFAAIGSTDTTAAAALAVLVALPPLALLALTGRFLTGRAESHVSWVKL